ncbi:MAG: fluoride efflux transporter CrcB [Planctomycetes bacterium HGW-Planctomycetes-1]|nr:MAG: fluoride efflux transporter CrcB [Planctomycetes bacterium HGW-Planctomycetes-1]
MFQKIFFLALAGAAGTLLRYWLGGFVQKNITVVFPFGTAAVNILGCLVFGLLWALLENRLSISAHLKTVIFISFFGAFTTFSSFAFDTVRFINELRLIHAFGNILLHNVCGFVGVIVGLTIGKYF